MKTYIPPRERRSANFSNKLSLGGAFLSLVLMFSLISAISAIQTSFSPVSAKTAKDKKEISQEVIEPGNIVGKKLTPTQIQETKVVVASQNLQNLPLERSWPVRGRITTYFSSAHTGIDIANRWGTPIHPFASGVVTSTGWQGSFGNAISISHNNGYVSTYAHLGAIYVGVGQEININTVIGVIGSTGRATGPHLHLQLTQFGRVVNPLSALP